MKIAVKDGKILIKEADATQMAIMKSWNKLKWNKSLQMMVGECDLEILQRLSTIVRLPGSIDAIRKKMKTSRRPWMRSGSGKNQSRWHIILSRNPCTRTRSGRRTWPC